MLANYIYKDPTSGHFTCNICYKANAQKNNIMKHIEGVHFPGQFVYTCSICSKNFNGKNSLQVHMYKFHNKPWKNMSNKGLKMMHFVSFHLIFSWPFSPWRLHKERSRDRILYMHYLWQNNQTKTQHQKPYWRSPFSRSICVWVLCLWEKI